jgi:putative membrane protein
MNKLKMTAAGLAVVASMAGVASAGAAGTPAMKGSGTDQKWIEEAVRIDLAEIGAGKLAMKEASSAKVKSLGKRLMSAHAKAIAMDESVARKAGATVPTAPTPVQKAVAKELEGLSAAEFDLAYPVAEVKGHLEAIKGAKSEIANGSDKAVIAMAKTDLKMYEMHLRWARAAENSGGAM